MKDYARFIAGKIIHSPPDGLSEQELKPGPAGLFPFQRDIVRWSLQRGRAAVFADCGLGKTAIQLAWADQITRARGAPVLILAPLAVAQQTVREGVKFGIRVEYSRDGTIQCPVTITNYERMHHFDTGAFVGVVLDESSILKSFMGKTKRQLLSVFAQTPFRLACTATPAPNDHLELGNHAEFLGVLSSHEMIARWFINDTSTFGTYRLKHFAVEPFWDWVCSWGRCIGKPSDLGHDDAGFELPELVEHVHPLGVDIVTARPDGHLFRTPDLSATAVHRERRRTAPARANLIANIIGRETAEPWIIWCETDYEADALRAAIPEAVEIRGSDPLEVKESRLEGFSSGEIRVLLTKPSLAGFGLNWQHCARVAFIGPTFSYEQYYQAIRRVWRFGQRRPVHVHTALAATETGIWDVMRRKTMEHERMKSAMFAAARRAIDTRDDRKHDYVPKHRARLPEWMAVRVEDNA